MPEVIGENDWLVKALRASLVSETMDKVHIYDNLIQNATPINSTYVVVRVVEAEHTGLQHCQRPALELGSGTCQDLAMR